VGVGFDGVSPFSYGIDSLVNVKLGEDRELAAKMGSFVNLNFWRELQM
jgi:hypothetical protein